MGTLQKIKNQPPSQQAGRRYSISYRGSHKRQPIRAKDSTNQIEPGEPVQKARNHYSELPAKECWVEGAPLQQARGCKFIEGQGEEKSSWSQKTRNCSSHILYWPCTNIPHYIILLQNWRVHKKRSKKNHSDDRAIPGTKNDNYNAKFMSPYHYKNGSINRLMPSPQESTIN